MHCCTNLRYNGYRVAVRSSDPTTLAWLEAFLAPSFELEDGNDFDCDVSLHEDPAEYETLYQGGPALCGTRVACFTQDGRFRLHPVWLGRGEEKVIYDEEFQVFYCFSGKQAAVRILAAHQTVRTRIPLMRVVRELATGDSLQRSPACPRFSVHGRRQLRHHQRAQGCWQNDLVAFRVTRRSRRVPDQ